MNKFEVDERGEDKDTEEVEKKFQSQLQLFVIQPYAERMFQFISELFTQLNFSEDVMDDLNKLKSKKKPCRKNQSSSAAKSTPNKGGDITKSPGCKRRKINNV